MGDTYAEAGVSRLPNIKTYITKFIIIALTVASLYLTAFYSIIFVSFVLVCIAAIGFVFPKLKVDYEYIYCDGQIDFDRISGKAKRKRMLRIDMEQIEAVAPVGSEAVASYRNNTNFQTKNFTSLRTNAKVYEVYYVSGESRLRILFEPSEKMLNCMKYKAPRKVTI